MAFFHRYPAARTCVVLILLILAFHLASVAFAEEPFEYCRAETYPIPVPKTPAEVLADACGGDARCVCINDAIFVHDSSWATAGVGAKALNPCNLRPPTKWTPSVPFTEHQSKNGVFAKFDTLEEGIIACVELWTRSYKGLSAFDTAKVWTGNKMNALYGEKPAERAYIAAIEACAK